MRDAPNPKMPALTADLSPDAWVHWDLDDDLGTPLNRQAPTVFSVGADLFAMPVKNPAGHQAQVFGVMAVAGAVGKFQGPEDGFTQHGSWTASDGREVPVRWPNYLSGPHVFMVETLHLLEARRVLGASNVGPDLQKAVSSAAYNWAHDRVNAGDISDRIERGDLWPLPNVWIGTTARMQSEVDHAGHLANVSAAHRFLRLRLLDEVSLRELFGLYEPEEGVFAPKVGSRWAGSPDWVIVSAPDGPSPQAAWVETIIAQCRGAGVPVWVDSDIGIGLPETMRVQELPQVATSDDAPRMLEPVEHDPTYPARFAEQAPCLCTEEPHPAWCPAYYRPAIAAALEARVTPDLEAGASIVTIVSDDELAEIEARYAAATDGEWLHGETALEAGHDTADWGVIYVQLPDAESGPTLRLVADTYAAWLTSKEEQAECRSRGRSERTWHEPAQVAANAEFIAAAHNTDIPRLIASVRALRGQHWHSEQVLDGLRRPGKLVYLDGRTEDAAHVVPFPMQTAEIDTDRDLTESAEAIYEEAAKLGYGDGCAVWCEFSHFPGQYGDFGMCEIAPGFEFVGINKVLTDVFGGQPGPAGEAPGDVPKTAAPPATPYTLADVDAALREILGHRIFDALRQSPSWSRPQLMKDAAAECFTRQRPEDQHSAVLRAAIQHMNKKGVIMPEDVRHEA